MLVTCWGSGRTFLGPARQTGKNMSVGRDGPGRSWSHVLPALAAWLALPWGREEQEPRKHAVVATLVLEAHGKKKRVHAGFWVNSFKKNESFYLHKQSPPALYLQLLLCWVSSLGCFVFVNKRSQTWSYILWPSFLPDQSTYKLSQCMRVLLSTL